MKIHTSQKTALVFGATGLVGSHLVSQLLTHPAYAEVHVFGRRALTLTHEKLRQHLVDFERLEDYRDLIKGDDLYGCLGTTRKNAGSKEAFRHVDFDYNYMIALIASRNGVNQYLLVSTVGADPASPFFYSKVKGELEKAVRELDFWSLHLFQPSLLLGERNENRFGEAIAQRIGRVVDRLSGNLLSRYKPIEAEYVATAMIHAAQQITPGEHVHASDALQRMAEAEEAKRPRDPA